MSDFGERLRAIRKDRGLSQEQLAEILGTSKQVISRYENGQRAPKITIASEFAERLGIPLAALSGDAPSAPNLPSNVKRISDIKPQRVRLIGEVAAGEPILAEEDYEAYIDVDAPIKADYALTVRGDSMEPTYLNGDVIYIRERPDVDDGQIAVVLVEDSATLKHVYHEKDGVLLVSENPKYSPMRKTFDEYDCIRILGIVVGYTRLYANANPLNGIRKGFPKK